MNKKETVVVCVMSLSHNRGGIATIGRLLSTELDRRGFNVVVLTFDYDGKFVCPNVSVIVRPNKIRVLKEFLLADYIMSVGDLVSFCWPLLFLNKKALVVKHGCVRKAKGNATFLHRLFERMISRHAAWGGVSQAVVKSDYIESAVVPNAYNPSVFYDSHEVQKNFDLLFVGGITEEKGVFVLAKALQILCSQHVRINQMTFVGEGKDELRLKDFLKSLQILKDVNIVFTGNLSPVDVADQMRRHRCLIVPSMNIVWQEAFAITVIEGLACGCDVVGSDSGGIPEAIGSCGLIFPSGDANSLALAIKTTLSGQFSTDRKLRAKHLSNYTPDKMVDRYFELISNKYE